MSRATTTSEDTGNCDPIRIVHLGGMTTTASRIGLQRFLEVCWPKILAEADVAPKLWVVGGLAGAPEDLVSLLQQPHVVCTGFVEDLDDVLRFGDLHIIPWEFNTGVRTRVPLALSYGQVVVSTKSGVTCFTELSAGRDCVLVPDLELMSNAIVDLLSDDDSRSEIASNARMTFHQNYTRKAVQPVFDEFLSSLLAPDSGVGRKRRNRDTTRNEN